MEVRGKGWSTLSRHCVPGASHKFASSLRLLDTAPLLEEKWDMSIITLLFDVKDPILVHRS